MGFENVEISIFLLAYMAALFVFFSAPFLLHNNIMDVFQMCFECVEISISFLAYMAALCEFFSVLILFNHCVISSFILKI